MKIALTGTPGTGKSSVAKALEARGHKIIDLNKVIFENKWDLGFDDEYQSTVADLAKLNAHVAEISSGDELQFFEGHLAHFLDLELAIVLRAHPKALAKRLDEHKYPPEKAKENIEAEALAVITTEALGRFEKLYEIDTTDRAVEETAELIEKLVKDPELASEYEPGKFDWLEEIV
jgi:adenylate kinase